MRFLFFIMLFYTASLAGNLVELIKKAHSNELADIAQLEQKRSRTMKDQIARSYYPSLTLGGNYIDFSDTGSNSPDNVGEIYAGIGFTIYDGGKRESLIDKHSALIDASDASKDNTLNQLSLETSKLYFEALALSSAIEAKRHENKHLKTELNRLIRYEAVGSAAKDDVEKIRANLALGEANLSELELYLEDIHLQLWRLTGENVAIDGGSEVLDPKKEVLEIEEIYNRPSLREADALVKSAQENISLEYSSKLPILKINNEYVYNHNEFESGEPINWDQPDSYNRFTITGVWKIFDFGSTDKAVEVARIDKLKADYQLKFEKRKANLEYRFSSKALELSKRKIEASEARLEAAEITFDYIEKKYHAGVVNNVTYLSALSDRFNAEAELAKNRMNYEANKAEYWYVVGKPIMEKVK